MKTIKVKFVGFWKGFDPKTDTSVLVSTIRKHYIIEESDNPDYIICSVFKINDIGYYDYCRYPQIRILYSGENYTPDFNFIDYAISPYPIEFQDRHFRFPVFCDDRDGRFDALKTKSRNYTKDILDSKPLFANLITGHESEYNLRGDFFKKLSEYKRVESYGTYLNNQPDSEVVTLYTKPIKQRRCKFTLCFESTKHEGFITEKITDAFFADTIPIYYGSSDVTDFFNKKAFINVSDYASFDEAIQKIIELDNDDDKYLEMLRQPIFCDIDAINAISQKLDEFIFNIFEQPLEKAKRRSEVYCPETHEKYLLELKDLKAIDDEKKEKRKKREQKFQWFFVLRKQIRKKKNNFLEVVGKCGNKWKK